MSDRRGYFDHHHQNGAGVALKLTTRPRLERIALPGYRKVKTDDMLGREVLGYARARAYDRGSLALARGQVWAQANRDHGDGVWWVVDSTGHPWLMREDDMTTVAERSEQLSIEDVS